MSVNLSIAIDLLVFVRALGLISTAPMFGGPQVPAIAKIGLGLFLAVVIVSAFPGAVLYPGRGAISLGLLVMLVIRESLVGIALGVTSGLVFAAVQYGGGVMDLMTGFAFSNIFSPTSQGTSTLLANYEYTLFVMLFIGLGGPANIILAVLESYRVVPIGAAVFGGPLADVLLRGVGDLTVIGMQIAGPVLFALFLSNVAMAVASRAVPQVNVFAVGLPLNLLIGLGVLLVVTPATVITMKGLLFEMDRQLGDALRAMGGLAA